VTLVCKVRSTFFTNVINVNFYYYFLSGFLLSEDVIAADLFALLVFACDDYLQLQPNGEDTKEKAFFRIGMKLPMDLQMVLCNRTFGWGSSIVSQKDSEASFKKYGRMFAQEKPTSTSCVIS
jgi:hypothetical protein